MSIKYALYKNFLSFTRCKKLKVESWTNDFSARFNEYPEATMINNDWTWNKFHIESQLATT